MLLGGSLGHPSINEFTGLLRRALTVTTASPFFLNQLILVI
jgi:hypothetical protein